MRFALGLMALIFLASPLAVTAQGISSEIQPKPAEMMPLADESMLLGVTDTGARLIAVGERGHIIGSLDGQEWVQVPTPTRATLTAVDFADENNGWAVGHGAVILRTRDGGRSWILQNFEPEKEQPFLDVLFLDSQYGFAVGAYSMMYVTRDGGETWEEFSSPIREDEWHFNSIALLNNGNLIIAGEAGTLAMSQDQGKTWFSLESPYSSSMFDVAPAGESGAILVGLRGNVFVSNAPADGNWEQITLESKNSIISAAQLPNGEIAMVGINGVIYRTSNGASRAQRIDNPIGITLAAVQPVKGALVAVGEAGPQLISQ